MRGFKLLHNERGLNMKSNIKKKFISGLLAILLMLPLFTNNYAYAQYNEMDMVEKATVIILDNLRASGLSEDDINYLLENNPITEESIKGGLLTEESDDDFMLFAAPGDTRPSTVHITRRFVESLGFGVTVGSGVAGWGLKEVQWFNVIIKAIGWRAFIFNGLVAAAAASCSYYYLYGYEGVELSLTETYIYGDNAMDYIWAVTAITSRRY